MKISSIALAGNRRICASSNPTRVLTRREDDNRGEANSRRFSRGHPTGQASDEGPKSEDQDAW